MGQFIEIYDAKENSIKNISLSIAKNKMAGPSPSIFTKNIDIYSLQA